MTSTAAAVTSAGGQGVAGVTIVALYPGLVRTENVVTDAAHFDLTNSESPQFSGRAIAALAADAAIARRNGNVLVAAELTAVYRFTDVDRERTPYTAIAVYKPKGARCRHRRRTSTPRSSRG